MTITLFVRASAVTPNFSLADCSRDCPEAGSMKTDSSTLAVDVASANFRWNERTVDWASGVLSRSLMIPSTTVIAAGGAVTSSVLVRGSATTVTRACSGWSESCWCDWPAWADLSPSVWKIADSALPTAAASATFRWNERMPGVAAVAGFSSISCSMLSIDLSVSAGAATITLLVRSSALAVTFPPCSAWSTPVPSSRPSGWRGRGWSLGGGGSSTLKICSTIRAAAVALAFFSGMIFTADVVPSRRSRMLITSTIRRMFADVSVMMIAFAPALAVTSASMPISGVRSCRSFSASTLWTGITCVISSSVAGISAGSAP